MDNLSHFRDSQRPPDDDLHEIGIDGVFGRADLGGDHHDGPVLRERGTDGAEHALRVGHFDLQHDDCTAPSREQNQRLARRGRALA